MKYDCGPRPTKPKTGNRWVLAAIVFAATIGAAASPGFFWDQKSQNASLDDMHRAMWQGDERERRQAQRKYSGLLTKMIDEFRELERSGPTPTDRKMGSIARKRAQKHLRD